VQHIHYLFTPPKNVKSSLQSIEQSVTKLLLPVCRWWYHLYTIQNIKLSVNHFVHWNEA